MRILNYKERKKLKESGCPANLYLAHYMRFLESLVAKGTREIEEPPVDFLHYIFWRLEFPNWVHGRLTSEHSAWRPEYVDKKLPMNEL